jgi:hypothetical protein
MRRRKEAGNRLRAPSRARLAFSADCSTMGGGTGFGPTPREARVERRLAAVLAAEVVGCSRLMGNDEAGTLARPKAHREGLINPRIPNDRLPECHEWIATLCDVPISSFCEGLRALRFVLWDEDRDTMVTFRESARRATP